MKVRISATIDKKTGTMLNSLVNDFEFRNKSHVIEAAIKSLMDTKKNNEN